MTRKSITVTELFARGQWALACHYSPCHWRCTLPSSPFLVSALRALSFLLLRCMHGSLCRAPRKKYGGPCLPAFPLFFACERGKDWGPNHPRPICDVAVTLARGGALYAAERGWRHSRRVIAVIELDWGWVLLFAWVLGSGVVWCKECPNSWVRDGKSCCASHFSHSSCPNLTPTT